MVQIENNKVTDLLIVILTSKERLEPHEKLFFYDSQL